MQKDQGALIAIIFAALVFVGSGVAWWLNYDEVMNETEGTKKKVADAKTARRVSEDKADKLKRQTRDLSDILGMQPALGEKSSKQAMVNHLNMWRDRLKQLGVTQPYATWSLDEGGEPKLVQAEGGGGELCYLKNPQAAFDLRIGNETKDYAHYLVAELISIKETWEAEAALLESEAQRAYTTHNENVGDGSGQGKLGTLIDEKARKIKELRDAIRNIEEAITRNQRESEQAIGDSEKAIRLKLDELDVIKSKHEGEVIVKKKKIGELTDRVFAITTKRQLARESTEADGEVIHSVSSELTAWIDIGRKDALLKGTRFEVFSMLKGGRKVPKGTAQVIDVKPDYSIIMLLRVGIVTTLEGVVIEGKVTERGNVVEVTESNGQKQIFPTSKVARLDYLDDGSRIEKGDFVANEVFDRKRAKVFVFGGKMRGRYTNEQMKNLIGEFGGQVQTDVQSETTYLVVGADFERDPNFEKAKNLGVKIIREQDLYQMLGVAR